MRYKCAKEFSVIGKILIFQEIAPNFTYSQKNVTFLKYNWNCLDQLLLPYKFHVISLRGIRFFNFASCELLKLTNIMWTQEIDKLDIQYDI